MKKLSDKTFKRVCILYDISTVVWFNSLLLDILFDIGKTPMLIALFTMTVLAVIKMKNEKR